MIGDANEVYTRTLSDTQAELARCLVELEEKRSMMEIAKQKRTNLFFILTRNLALGHLR